MSLGASTCTKKVSSPRGETSREQHHTASIIFPVSLNSPDGASRYEILQLNFGPVAVHPNDLIPKIQGADRQSTMPTLFALSKEHMAVPKPGCGSLENRLAPILQHVLCCYGYHSAANQHRPCKGHIPHPQKSLFQCLKLSTCLSASLAQCHLLQLCADTNHALETEVALGPSYHPPLISLLPRGDLSSSSFI